jgi:hypothetical protein
MRKLSLPLRGRAIDSSGKLWELAHPSTPGCSVKVGFSSERGALPEISADIAYFDPPYPGVMSYEKEYRVIDEILEGRSRPTSPFTAKDGAGMIDHLFDRAIHIPVWILSLGNAVVGIDELEAKMTRLGRKTKALELLPASTGSDGGEEAANREFLVVGGTKGREALIAHKEVGAA